MRKIRWVELVLGAWCVGLVLAAVTALVPGWVKLAEWSGSPGAPAWVQAVGSILAILTAAVIALWQANDQRNIEAERRRLSVLEKLHAVNMLLNQALALYELFDKIIDKPSKVVWQSLATETELLRQRIDRLPLFELPSWKVGPELMLLDQSLRAMDDVCSNERTILTHQERQDLWRASIRWKTQVERAIEWCTEEAIELHTEEERLEAIARGYL